ncbi:MAG: RDD family protein [Nanoarchaeota archaeon]
MVSLRLPQQRKVAVQAGLFKRLLAFLIDILVLDFMVFSPFKALVTGMVPGTGIMETAQFLTSNPAVTNRLILVSAVIGLLSLAYFAALEFLVGQTVGKAVLGIFVACDRKRPSLWQAIVRNLFAIPLFPFILFWIIDPLFMLFSGRRLLERLSRTKTMELVQVT